MSRIAIVCPGRGSYTKKSLGTLPQEHELIDRAEAVRAEYGLKPLRELDGAERFIREEQLRADNVSPLIYLHSMLDAAIAQDGNETVCVCGSSMGWYSALALAGALGFEDGLRLVQTMALLQMEQADGGQVLFPLVNEEWQQDPRLADSMRAALQHPETYASIHLGGYAVLAGTEAGVAHLRKTLPAVERGPTIFPYRLKGHGPYHSPLQVSVAKEAARQLKGLKFRAPTTTLIDGRGVQFSPWTTDPDALQRYTLGPQITTPYDFTASIRVALREFAPDRLALLGPENSLGGVCAQIVIAERWRGIDRRDALPSDMNLLWSLRP